MAEMGDSAGRGQIPNRWRKLAEIAFAPRAVRSRTVDAHVVFVTAYDVLRGSNRSLRSRLGNKSRGIIAVFSEPRAPASGSCHLQ
jgi:hypothetical protein